MFGLIVFVGMYSITVIPGNLTVTINCKKSLEDENLITCNSLEHGIFGIWSNRYSVVGNFTNVRVTRGKGAKDFVPYRVELLSDEQVMPITTYQKWFLDQANEIAEKIKLFLESQEQYRLSVKESNSSIVFLYAIISSIFLGCIFFFVGYFTSKNSKTGS